MKVSELKVALIGDVAAGKTSFLAALKHAGPVPVKSGLATWHARADPTTSFHLLEQWRLLKKGEPTVKNLPERSTHDHLRLTLIRNRVGGDGGQTHQLQLDVLDSSGEFLRRREDRQGEFWDEVAGRIAGADVLLLMMDAMGAYHVYRRDETRSSNIVDDFLSLLVDAYDVKPITGSPKPLAVCITKCDAVLGAGSPGPLRGGLLTDCILSPIQQQRLREGCDPVHYFPISILGESWRWSRAIATGESEGACVRVGGLEFETHGLFQPFEWIVGMIGRHT